MSRKKTLNALSECSVFAVNCRICRGELLPVPAPAGLNGSVPAGIIFAARSEGADRIFACTQTHAYVSGDGANFIMLNPLAGGSLFLIEDIDGGIARAVIINGENAVAHDGSSFKGFAYGANLCRGVMHCGRLFGVDGADGLLVRWSGEGGVKDWKEGLYGSGYLKLDPERGEILDMVAFGEKLVAVRKYGLTVLSMFGSAENFSVDFTDTDTDGIYGGTAKVVGGTLLFFTSSGLHSFDGATVKRLTHSLSDDASSPVCAASLAGRYYLSCQSKTLKGRAVMCYDVRDGESWLIDVAADAMCAADKLYIYNSDGAYVLADGGEYSCTVSGVDFGTDRRKTVKEIFIDGKADIVIDNGRTARTFLRATGTVKPKLSGKRFTIKIKGVNRISKLTVTGEMGNAI